MSLVLKAAAILAAGLLVARLSRRASAAHRHGILLAALAGTLALPLFAAVLPTWEVLPAAGAGAAAAPSAMLYVWAAGAAAGIARLGLLTLSAERLIRRSRPVADARVLLAALRAREELGARMPVHLGFSENVSLPVSGGLLRPAVLLPPSAAGWSRGRLRAVFLHEVAHLARRDRLTLLLAGAAAAVWWFLPPAWWALRQLRLEMERACDDRVLAGGVRPSGYATLLLRIWRGARRPTPALAFGAGMASGRSELRGRIGALLSSRPRRGRLGRPAAIALLAALLLVAPLAMAGRAAPAPGPAHTHRAHAGASVSVSVSVSAGARAVSR